MFLHEQDLNGCLDFNVNHYRENVDFDECYFITLYKPALGMSDGEARHIVKEGRASGWWGFIDQDYLGYGHLDELYHLPTGLCVGYFPSVRNAVHMAEKFDQVLTKDGHFQKGIFHLMAYAIRRCGMTFQYDHKSNYRELGMQDDVGRITEDLTSLDQSAFLRSFVELNGDLFDIHDHIKIMEKLAFFNFAEFENFAGARRMIQGHNDE